MIILGIYFNSNKNEKVLLNENNLNEFKLDQNSDGYKYLG